MNLKKLSIIWKLYKLTMKLNKLKVFYNYFNIKEKKYKNLSLALGFFDGVHLGHKKVIGTCVEKAKENKLKSAVLTFTNHPKCFINKVTPQYILDINDRLRHIENLNVDYCFIYDFNDYFLNLDYYRYIKDILINNFEPRYITTGFNHYFGHNREGNCDKLKINENNFGYIYDKIEPFKIESEIVSSSLIREMLNKGNIEEANKMLSYNFYIEGKVISGNKIGRTINYPTANFLYKENIILIPYGVYAVQVEVENNLYYGVLNFGLKPTINDKNNEPLCEVHILNFNCDIYNKNIKVKFVKRIRGERKFNNIDELKNQISVDVKTAIKVLCNFNQG